MIPLVKEPEHITRQAGTEVCEMCNTPTVYWHENTNNPLCHPCAKKYRVADLPDHGQRVRALKRKGQWPPEQSHD